MNVFYWNTKALCLFIYGNPKKGFHNTGGDFKRRVGNAKTSYIVVYYSSAFYVTHLQEFRKQYGDVVIGDNLTSSILSSGTFWIEFRFQCFNVIRFSFFPTNNTACLHFKEENIWHLGICVLTCSISDLVVMYYHTFAQVLGLTDLFLAASCANHKENTSTSHEILVSIKFNSIKCKHSP